MSAPERIWAKRVPITVACDGEWWSPHHDCLDELPEGAVEYIRADVAADLIADLERRLGGGCDASADGQHVAIKQGTYAFCQHCGESLVGVRYVAPAKKGVGHGRA